MTGPHRKFCEGIAAGLNQGEAYLAAYPGTTLDTASKNAHRLMDRADIKAEIQMLRDEAQKLGGSAVLTLLEKRIFLARLVRANLNELDLKKDGDLLQSIMPTEHGVKLTLADKLRAIEIDNDLAGEGVQAEANDALGELLEKIRDGVPAPGCPTTTYGETLN